MNHVVEGILGAYAPYYVPAPVDVTFLEDFRELSQALPRVRPTIFFSVPRFYEKVWERFKASGVGRLYGALSRSASRASALRNLARPVLRKALLRKAGLHCCAQLLVGSAPCAPSLLESFHELGIELHNAFGLTEAPLVTINRLGANHLGTVGRALPSTEVRIAHDGEVLVRGPQVSAVSDDGWLHTGDLGAITDEGDLVIIGRKKEILITSYGKNIHPAKIESLLREIPGMADAMVLGDNRPSLSALLWLAGGSATPQALQAIDRAVHGINGGLSHPEQLKRWAVLSEHPAIENGELTGNLKIRRQVVLARRTAVVEMLYGEAADRDNAAMLRAEIPGVLHVGAIKCA
jgi:long-chain acyl-CoA synthetase